MLAGTPPSSTKDSDDTIVSQRDSPLLGGSSAVDGVSTFCCLGTSLAKDVRGGILIMVIGVAGASRSSSVPVVMSGAWVADRSRVA